jgi:hypothetical protein
MASIGRNIMKLELNGANSPQMRMGRLLKIGGLNLRCLEKSFIPSQRLSAYQVSIRDSYTRELT